MLLSSSGVRVYIDGFNLYFAMKDQHWRKYYWLDVYALSVKLLQMAKSQGFIDSAQQIDSVRYFTSRIPAVGHSKDKATRQNTYLEALEAYNREISANLTISYGAYQLKPHICEHCKRRISLPVEKMTDVNLATDLLADAFFDKYQTAIVISGDSDLTAPVQAIKDLFENKNTIVAVPPDRWSSHLAQAADRYLMIRERQLQQCQLPDEVRRKDRGPVKRPRLWR